MTTSVTVVDWVRLPLVPVIVRVYEPIGVVVAFVVTLRVDEPAPVMDVGLKVPAAPVGNPVTPSVTTPVNPFSAPVVVV